MWPFRPAMRCRLVETEHLARLNTARRQRIAKAISRTFKAEVASRERLGSARVPQGWTEEEPPA